MEGGAHRRLGWKSRGGRGVYKEVSFGVLLHRVVIVTFLKICPLRSGMLLSRVL